MKRTARLLILLVVLLAGLLCLAAFLLRTRLTDLVRERVLPNLETQLGVPLAVDQVSADLFGGQAELRGLTAANPPGFGDQALFRLDRAHLQIAWAPLLRGMLDIRSADFQKVDLHLLRLEDGDLNIRHLVKPAAEKPGPTGAGTPPDGDQPPPTDTPTPC